MEMAKAILKKGRETALERFHPWIFSGAIYIIDSTISDGDWVDIVDSNNTYLATGHIQNGSIAIRILSYKQVTNKLAFYTEVFQNALQARIINHLPDLQTNVYRFIHGEGDGLSGLIIDVYNDVAVVEAHTWGMHVDRFIICEAIQSIFKEKIKAVYYIPEHVGDPEDRGFLFGVASMPVEVIENGLKFYVNSELGQKTGFFIDQRVNRQLLMQYVSGKKVLNTFSYTGGFSVYALHAKAMLVHSVDVSKKAIDVLNENVKLNFGDIIQHESFVEDVFEFIEKSTEKYDVIVLDPPAFAKHLDAKHQAMKGYQRLNALALSKINKGGIIFTFSCSQVVNKELFYNTIVSAAIIAKRNVRVLHHLTQGPDHPVSIFHPEGSYLKGLVLLVE